ncbi:type I polyketide synthase [Chlorella sorokiniana]|uniref:Type I polyketide synthase n=1 Tax=Chlorella sorokiniana TaxID=3076 RepID=A0A2P6TUZ6_CHLSO|nr:type I polyketide synthase [Chlorella sorokiniana]|eukprot:PRW57893.1 type I polyketide synthase [Chlorella sorokiniana]
MPCFPTKQQQTCAQLSHPTEGWQAQGLAATSIAWGAWGGAGMAAASPAVATRLARVGVAAIQPLAGLAALEQAAAAARSGTVMAAALLWQRLLVDGRQQAPFFAEFAAVAAAAAARSDKAADASVTVAVTGRQRSKQRSKEVEVQQAVETLPAAPLPAWATLDWAERLEFFTSQLSALVAQAAGKAVDPSKPLLSAGLDSLGAVEVRREAAQLAGMELPVTLIFDYPSVAEIAAFIVGKLPAPVAEQPSAAPVPVAAGSSGASRKRSSGGRRHRRALAAVPAEPAPLSAEERLAIARSKVLGSVAAVLGGAEVAASMPLMNAGLDSLSAVELRKELNSAFGIELPPTVVFDYPTVDDLVGHLAAHVPAPPAAAAAPAAAAEGYGGSLSSDCDSGSDSDGELEAGSSDMAAVGNDQRQLVVRRSSSDREQEPPNTQLVPAGALVPLGPVNKRAPRLTKPGYFTVPSMERLACMSDAELRAVPRLVIGRSGVGEIAYLYPVNLLDADLDEIVSIERGRIALYPNRTPPTPAPLPARPALPGPARAASKSRQLALLAPAGPPPETPAAAAGRRRARLLATLHGGSSAMHAPALPLQLVRPPVGEGLNQPALLTFRRMALRQPADRRAVDAFRGRLFEAAARMGGLFVHYDPVDGVWLLKLDTWL